MHPTIASTDATAEVRLNRLCQAGAAQLLHLAAMVEYGRDEGKDAEQQQSHTDGFRTPYISRRTSHEDVLFGQRLEDFRQGKAEADQGERGADPCHERSIRRHEVPLHRE